MMGSSPRDKQLGKEIQQQQQYGGHAGGTFAQQQHQHGSSSSGSGGGGGRQSKSNPKKVKNCLRIFLAHLFSHVGLCILIVSYACAGALLFERLEADKELEIRAATNATWSQNISKIRRDCVGELWNITIKFNVLYEVNWTRSVDKILKVFEDKVANTAATDGYLAFEDGEKKKKWSFSGALLYAVSIITTIGYGDRVPKTEKGKVLTMFYAVIGVPLMLLWLSNIGSLMANTFKFVYSHARCKSSSSSTAKPVHNNCIGSKSNHISSTYNHNHVPVSTQVKYSIDQDVCETTLMPLPLINESARLSHSRESAYMLEPDAKRVLQECAEYNLSMCDDPRSRRVLHQLYKPGGGDGEDSSDGESVIDISAGQGIILSELPPPEPSRYMSVVTGSVVGISDGTCHHHSSSPILHPNKRSSSLFECVVGGGGQRVPQHYGTPSKIPLLVGESGPDLVDMSIEDDIPAFHHLPPPSSPDASSPVPGNKERVPISLVLAFVVAYLMVGAACFNAWEGWNLLDSAYFCFITLSTIGLGDLTPGKSLEAEKSHDQGHGQLIFCCLYLVLGLAIIAMSFNLVQEEVVAKVKHLARHIGIIKEDTEL